MIFHKKFRSVFFSNKIEERDSRCSVVEGEMENFFPVSLYKTRFLLLDSVMEAERRSSFTRGEYQTREKTTGILPVAFR